MVEKVRLKKCKWCYENVEKNVNKLISCNTKKVGFCD